MKLLVLIVSHAHGVLAERCAAQIQAGFAQLSSSLMPKHEVILLHNIPEPAHDSVHPLPDIAEIWNAIPLGFAENHNQVFLNSNKCAHNADWLLIANPDLEWGKFDAFESVVYAMQTLEPDVGAVTLRQISSTGSATEYLRRLITPWQLIRRAICSITDQPDKHITINQADWFNGACLLVRKEAFHQIQGFDERYHMYCEDVDLCIRLQLAGWKLSVLDAKVTHDGRRSSRRHWRFFLFHITSLLRLWSSSAFWRYLRFRASKDRPSLQATVRKVIPNK
jgi:N-acetylglucosaminyl-diphospho-decaprenol L-rhamnosyltransferase